MSNGIRRSVGRGLLLLAVSTAAGWTIIPAGCGPARRVTPSYQPQGVTDPQFQRGQHAFMTHCYQCHPSGASGLGPALNDKPLPPTLIRTQVRQGLGAMPAFSEEHIPDDELDDLVAYVKALRR